MTCSQGAQARMAFEADATFDGGSIRTDFLHEGLQKKGRLIGGQGIAGTRSHMVERMRFGSYEVGGPITLQPGPALLDFLLPRILGKAAVSTAFALDEPLLGMSVLVDKVGSVFQYDAGYVDRAIFRAEGGPGDSEPEIVELTMETQFKTETKGVTWPVAVPAISVASNSLPYIMSEGVLTIGGTGYQFKKFALVVDNFLQRRWVNSLTATEICPRDRRVMLVTEMPFTSTEYTAFYDAYVTGTPVAATLVFTHGGMSTTFTMASLGWANETPVVRGKTEIPLFLNFEVLKSTTTPELAVTHDSVA